MKNSSTKRKVIIALSIITAIFAVVTLVLGAFFVFTAKNTISTKMANYHVNQKTVMWIADLGAPFFGNSTIFAIVGIGLSLIALIVVSTIWIVAAIKKAKNKGQGSNGTVVAVALTSITAVAAVAALGVSSYGTAKFKHNTNMDNVSSYFESHAEELSKTPEKAAKGGLLYVLANKDDISAFSKASVLQLSLAAPILMGYSIDPDMQALLPTKEVQAEFAQIDKDVTFTFSGKKQSFNDWWQNSLTLPATPKKHGANMLVNIDSWNKVLNGNYPNLHKAFNAVYKKQKQITSMIWDAFPKTTKLLLVEMGYTDKQGTILKDGIFDLMANISKKSLTFEKRVIGTISKMLALPYDTHDNQVKSRITVLEWLSSTINSIDYISKDEEYSILKNIESTWFENGAWLPATVKDPQNIYAGLYKKDGTISIDTSKKMGTVGNKMYDIKLNLMKDVLKNLPTKTATALKERQKTITPLDFVTHVLESKGLKELTNQYAAFNSDYDNNNVYGDKGEARHIASAAKKLVKFLAK